MTAVHISDILSLWHDTEEEALRNRVLGKSEAWAFGS